MERRDYLMSQIEKLIIAIKRLIGLIKELTSDNFEESMEQVNDDLESQFGFNLNNVSKMTHQDFISKIKDIDEESSELFAQLLSQVSKKINSFKKEDEYNSKELAEKALIILDNLDEKTKTYSFKRSTLKKELQQQIA